MPIGLQAKKALLDYLAKERPNPANPQVEGYVYLTVVGFPLTHGSVEKMFQRVKKLADLPSLHPRACRHTFSVRYLVNDGDAFSLLRILGHTSF